MALVVGEELGNDECVWEPAALNACTYIVWDSRECIAYTYNATKLMKLRKTKSSAGGEHAHHRNKHEIHEKLWLQPSVVNAHHALFFANK